MVTDLPYMTGYGMLTRSLWGANIQVCLSMMPFLFGQMSIHLAPGIRSDVELFGKSTFFCVFYDGESEQRKHELHL